MVFHIKVRFDLTLSKETGDRFQLEAWINQFDQHIGKVVEI